MIIVRVSHQPAWLCLTGELLDPSNTIGPHASGMPYTVSRARISLWIPVSPAKVLMYRFILLPDLAGGHLLDRADCRWDAAAQQCCTGQHNLRCHGASCYHRSSFPSLVALSQ